MVLFADRHRPQSLSKLTLHQNLTNQLEKLSKSNDFPHLLFYGPSGAGKSLRAHLLLKELFGQSIERKKLTHKTIKLSSKIIEISLITSNNHIELTPSDVGSFNDRQVIQELITEIAQTPNVSSNFEQKKLFKIVIIHESDRLSIQAQQALRRTMEIYSSTCKLILLANSITKIISPIRSRCLCIRIPAPKLEECVKILRLSCEKENINCSETLLKRIAQMSDFNLRRSLLTLEVTQVRNGKILEENVDLLSPDWIVFVDTIARLICEEQSPQRLMIVRSKFYELLSNCIPAEIILITLVKSLLRRCDDTIKGVVIEQASEYNHRLSLGSKPIFHLEAFVAKFMAIYKSWIVSTFG